MNGPPSRDDAFDRALEAGWLRRLARGLLADPSEADDVLQEAWTKLGTGGGRPGYLAAVVRSLAGRRRRAAERRTRRERIAARTGALPSAAEVAERSELARLLAEAVEALEEPYRTTVVLRFYEDLSSAEIARRAGIPAATVRARLKRGLDVLRARLDDREGGRTRWISALLPLARPRSEELLPLGSAAVLVAMKLTLVSVLAVAGLLVLWRAAAPDAPTDRPVGSIAARSGSLDGLDSQSALEGEGEETSRVAMPVDTEQLVEHRGIASEPTKARLHGRVVDRGRRPLPNPWIRLRHAPEARARGDEEGEVELVLEVQELERFAAVDRSHRLEVEVGAPGMRERCLRRALPEGTTAIELGEIVLPPGGAVEGRVTDETGRGVPGALVVFGAPFVAYPGEPSRAHVGPRDLDIGMSVRSDEEHPVVGTSGPSGAFRLEGLPVGHGTVWACSATTLWASAGPFGLHAGDVLRGVELVLEEAADETLSGRVVDPEGRPIPGLLLALGRTGSTDGRGWFTSTDARGGFHLAVDDGAALDVSASSPSPDWDDLMRQGVRPGSHDLVLAFERSRWLNVVVQDPAGDPVRGGRVVGLEPEGPTSSELLRCESALDDRGRARLRRPRESLRVRVEAHGYRDLVLGPFEPAAFPDPLVATVEPVPALLGRVLEAGGAPVAGVRVDLYRGGEVRLEGGGAVVRSWFSTQAWSGDRESFVTAVRGEPLATATTDEEGRYRLPLPGADARSQYALESPQAEGPVLGGPSRRDVLAAEPPGTAWYVHARIAGRATTTSGPHVLDPSSDVTVDLRLPPGGAISGRFEHAQGHSLAGWTAWASDGLAEVVSASVAEKGSFLLENLHPGGWQVRAFEPGRLSPVAWGNVRHDRAPVSDVEVVAGSTVAYEHVTTSRQRARLLGSLRVAGVPPAVWQVDVRTGGRNMVFTTYATTLDPEGSFEVSLEPGLRTWIRALGNVGDAMLSVQLEVEIFPGVNEWSLDLETARVEAMVAPGTIQQSETPPVLTYEWERDGVQVNGSTTLAQGRRLSPLVVPAGRGLLRGPKPNLFGKGPVWAELDLRPGETRRLELPPE